MAKICKPYEPLTDRLIRILVYGEPGIGKTTFGMTAPKPLLIDCDGGIDRVSPAFRSDFIQVSKWKDISSILEDKDVEPYESLVIDTAGKALEYLAIEIIKDNYKLGTKTGGLSLQGYGALLNSFTAFLRRATVKKKNIIFIAHNKEYKTDEGMIYRPDIVGSNLGAILKEMDLVGFMQSRDNVRTIGFTPQDTYYGKNSCRLEDIIKVPDLNKVEAKPLSDIVERFHKIGEEQEELSKEYRKYLADVEPLVATIKDEETANTALDTLQGFPDLWDLKTVARSRVRDKLKDLKLVYDKELETVVPDMGKKVDLKIEVKTNVEEVNSPGKGAKNGGK